MQEAKALFQKLKIVSLLDLALLIPASYNNTTLSKEIKIGENQTFEAKVNEVTSFNGKLRISFYLPQFNKNLTSMLFRVTPYHYKLYTVGSHHYIQGKVEEYKGYLQINQAKSLKKIGEILPKYSTVLKENSIRSLIEYYITEQNLYAEGLDKHEVRTLLGVHYPKNISEVDGYDKEVLKFIEAFNHMKKLKGKKEIFPALKSLNGELDNFINGLPFSVSIAC
jgi:ATP-dependent DNA helicase RecG